MIERFDNPDYTPPLPRAAALGVQHVLAMFASNVTPAIIIAGAAGLAGADKIYMVQMAILFAGLATLMQTVGFGNIGARLPIMQGTSFVFVPLMIPLAASSGVAVVFGGVIAGGIFHFLVGMFVISRVRRFLPPLITGLIILSIGIALIPIGVQSGGGVWLMNNKPELFGTASNWTMALVVPVLTTIGVKFFARGFASSAAVLIGLAAGYVIALLMGNRF